MIGVFKRPLRRAVWAGIILLTTPCLQARGGFSVQVYDDGVLQAGITTLVSGDSLVFLGSTTHFSITNGSGQSNNPGTTGGSNLALSSNEQIGTTFGAAGGTHTIQIVLTQTDWTAPGGTLLNLSSSAGGSISYLSGGSNPNATDSVTATYRGFLDNTNTPFGQPAGASTPLQTASASLGAPRTAPLVFSPSTVTTPVPGGTPFSMTDVLTFTFNLSAGSGQDMANVSASTVAALPEPSSMMAALAAVPFLGLGAWLRRRKPVAIA